MKKSSALQKPHKTPSSFVHREASWNAVALHRFFGEIPWIFQNSPLDRPKMHI